MFDKLAIGEYNNANMLRPGSNEKEPISAGSIAKRHGLLIYTREGDFGNGTVIARDNLLGRLDARLQGWFPIDAYFAYDSGPVVIYTRTPADASQMKEFDIEIIVLPRSKLTDRRLLEEFVDDYRSRTGKRIMVRYLPTNSQKKS